MNNNNNIYIFINSFMLKILISQILQLCLFLILIIIKNIKSLHILHLIVNISRGKVFMLF